jgi:hypothetical protein
MWSYYANGHRGICLGFSQSTRPFGPTFQVLYASDFPQINFFDSDFQDQFKATFLTKAFQWNHEREWRVIDRNLGQGLRQFPPASLTEIIMGAQISDEDRTAIEAWIAARPDKPALFEARLKGGVYGLEIHRVAPEQRRL